jgi:hypothetical protein
MDNMRRRQVVKDRARRFLSLEEKPLIDEPVGLSLDCVHHDDDARRFRFDQNLTREALDMFAVGGLERSHDRSTAEQ